MTLNALQENTETKTSTELTLLLVEDDTYIREALADILREDFSCRVLTAENGLHALKQLQIISPRPDVIILDVMMPEMDGWQFRKAQLEDPRLAEIPVIVLTARADKPAEAQHMDIQYWIKKPIDLSSLRQKIRECLVHS